ncbi:gamma-glutamyltranspeptidase [Klebsiella grimontii]|uniref:Gamma-glutamyltranspeptidase n=1 Tax=Klebsiella grimontii TaxID=2058152 RepID=A0A7H4P6H3_9ENTR|nr:gamma-glutamyltranspeptidase [Klebsiella grimontii]
MQSHVAAHGMAVAPHHLASQSALAVLREGGSAIEAMVAAAATIAVVYPHMNGLGGDGFWLIVPPEGDPIAIDASGAAGSLATPQAYAGLAQIPHRGPQAALTVAGTVSGWDEALKVSRELSGRSLPLSRLLGRCHRLRRERHPGYRLAGQRHRREIQRTARPARLRRNLSGGRPAAEGREPLFAAGAGEHSAPVKRGRIGQLLSRAAGGASGPRYGQYGTARDPQRSAAGIAPAARCRSGLSISTGNCGTSRRRPRGWFRWQSSASPTGWRWPTPTMR